MLRRTWSLKIAQVVWRPRQRNEGLCTSILRNNESADGFRDGVGIAERLLSALMSCIARAMVAQQCLCCFSSERVRVAQRKKRKSIFVSFRPLRGAPGVFSRLRLAQSTRQLLPLFNSSICGSLCLVARSLPFYSRSSWLLTFAGHEVCQVRSATRNAAPPC